MASAASPGKWHSRGYLQHYDRNEAIQFVTLRLFDSVPKKVISKWKSDLQYEDDDFAQQVLGERISKYEDLGYGECFLAKPEIATIVETSLQDFDDIRYRLFSWVIMPNHVHFLIQTLESFSLSEIMKSFKGYTARMANRALDRNGSFWQEDYFDREIRDLGDFIEKLDYIDMNPVKAGLCKMPEEWRFGRARFERDFKFE